MLAGRRLVVAVLVSALNYRNLKNWHNLAGVNFSWLVRMPPRQACPASVMVFFSTGSCPSVTVCGRRRSTANSGMVAVRRPEPGQTRHRRCNIKVTVGLRQNRWLRQVRPGIIGLLWHENAASRAGLAGTIALGAMACLGNCIVQTRRRWQVIGTTAVIVSILLSLPVMALVMLKAVNVRVCLLSHWHGAIRYVRRTYE